MPGSPTSHFFVRPGFVLAGLIHASGPARFPIGTSILAQPELNVPMTPMTDLLVA